MKCCEKEKKCECESDSGVKSLSTELSFQDHFDYFLFRFGYNRYNRRVKPGVYKIGNPDKNSPLLASCNFQISLNVLKASLKGISAWILVIDTKGINVWCAAGKGTFGTTELVKRLKEFKVNELVDHKTLILPQLGAPGTSAHIIKAETGFKVKYGPVRAKDIPAYLQNGNKADLNMRKVEFRFWDRLELVPFELVLGGTSILKGLVLMLLISLFSIKPLTFSLNVNLLIFLGVSYIMGVFSGAAFTPILLPIIPFRSFVLKGFFMGLIVQGLILLFTSNSLSNLQMIGSIILFPILSAYVAFNFTGCSTFTSKSGVKKELDLYLKPIKFFAIFGLIILTLSSVGLI